MILIVLMMQLITSLKWIRMMSFIKTHLKEPYFTDNKLQKYQDEDKILELVDVIDKFKETVPVACYKDKAMIVNRKYSFRIFRYALKDYWRNNVSSRIRMANG